MAITRRYFVVSILLAVEETQLVKNPKAFYLLFLCLLYYVHLGLQEWHYSGGFNEGESHIFRNSYSSWYSLSGIKGDHTMVYIYSQYYSRCILYTIVYTMVYYTSWPSYWYSGQVAIPMTAPAHDHHIGWPGNGDMTPCASKPPPVVCPCWAVGWPNLEKCEKCEKCKMWAIEL